MLFLFRNFRGMWHYSNIEHNIKADFPGPISHAINALCLTIKYVPNIIQVSGFQVIGFLQVST